MDQQSNLKEEIKKADAGELIHIKPPITCTRGSHTFKQISATEAECEKCRVGYNLTPGVEVKNGHIYLHGTLLI